MKNDFMVKLTIALLIMLFAGAVFVVNGINSYKDKIFNLTYNDVLSKLGDAVISLDADEIDFFESPVYSDSELENYSKTEKFLAERVGVRKDCGSSNGSCFASQYKDTNKKIYNPQYKGACAVLNNGTSICLMPQIKDEPIHGIMDFNGKGSPNVLGKDLRTFELKAHKRHFSDVEVGKVNTIYNN